jgi:hypothetical protein
MTEAQKTAAKQQGGSLQNIPTLTFATLRPQIDKRLPDEVVRALAQMKPDRQKIVQVNAAAGTIAAAAGNALDPRYSQNLTSPFKALNDGRAAALFLKNMEPMVEIAKSAGESTFSAFLALELDPVAGLFSKNPGKFVEIARFAGKSCDSAFDTLRDSRIAALYSKNPDAVVGAMASISKYAGEDTAGAFIPIQYERVAGLFARNPDKFVEIAKQAGEDCGTAFAILDNAAVAALFSKNPDTVVGSFAEIAKYAGKERRSVFNTIGNSRVAGLFAQHPDIMAELAKCLQENSRFLFDAFKEDDRIARLFAGNPGTMADIARVTGKSFMSTLRLLKYNERVIKNFARLAGGSLSMDGFLACAYSQDDAPIEAGRPIDDLHEREKERRAYIDSLSGAQVVGLICSNPGYFFTSSNHLLFDRLKKDLGSAGITDGVYAYLKKRYYLDNEMSANLIFRAINYDRLLGAPNSIFKPADAKQLGALMLAGVKNNVYDPNYFYMLANSVRKVSGYFPDMLGVLNTGIAAAAKTGEEYRALTVIKYLINPDSVDAAAKAEMKKLDEKSVYDQRNYVFGGKVQVLQVFDKDDVGKDHWPMSQKWFEARYGKPVSNNGKEIVYEGKNARVILYMGDGKSENQAYARAWMGKNSQGIVTFRGHSFSLMGNMPVDIFGNRKNRYLFIPGSCGSAGSVPQYMIKNPQTDIRHFSNTSTGRGQVTNAILDILLGSAGPANFADLLKQNSKKIEANGGDIKTIKVWSEGEKLISYVLGNGR